MTTVQIERDPWERQPKEPAKAFQAFTAYRDMGPTRSLRRIGRNVPRAIEEQPANTWPMQSLGNWSTRHAWVARADAWDRHLDQIAREQQEQRRREMVDQHDALATQMLNRVAQRLVGDQVAGVDPLDISTLKAPDLIRMFVESVKVQRISRGEPTEVTQHTGPDGGPLQHQVSAAPQNTEELLKRIQGLEDLGELPAGSVAAYVALGLLPAAEEPA